MGLLDNAIANERSIQSSLNDIKDAANNKGAGIGPATKLNEWASKIETIPSAYIPEIRKSTSAFLPSIIRVADTLTMPTESISGEPMDNNTLKLGAEAPFWVIICGCRKLVVPNYYRNYELWNGDYPNNLGRDGLTTIEEIVFEGTGYFSALRAPNRNLGYSLRKIDLPNATGNLNIDFQNFPDNANFNITAPNISTIVECHLVSSGVINLTADFSNVTRITYNSWEDYSVGFENVSGDINLPNLTYLGQISITSGHLKLYMPEITESYRTFYKTQYNNHGLLELYFGPNMTSFDPGYAADAITAGELIIHIPAGDSTTKTTLDNAGITYVQDYVI